MAEDSIIYEHIIWQDEEGFNQVRVVINMFRGIEYLHIRKYYLDFDGDFQASDKGLAIPLEVESTCELFKAIAEVMSLAECKDTIEEMFGNTIKDLYSRQ